MPGSNSCLYLMFIYIEQERIGKRHHQHLAPGAPTTQYQNHLFYVYRTERLIPVNTIQYYLGNTRPPRQLTSSYPPRASQNSAFSGSLSKNVVVARPALSVSCRRPMHPPTRPYIDRSRIIAFAERGKGMKGEDAVKDEGIRNSTRFVQRWITTSLICFRLWPSPGCAYCCATSTTK